MPNESRLTSEGNSRIEIKKSVFIGHCAQVASPAEAADFIAKERKQYPDARHICYAWRTCGDSANQKSSDDGEPQGTGGTPVLDVLMKEGLTDVCVVVTRYFGGILLGGGGLVRAYSHACKLAVDAADKMRMCLCSRFTVSCDYSLYGRLTYVLPEFSAKTVSEGFADDVKLTVLVKSGLAGKFRDKLVDISNGTVSLDEEKDLWEDLS